MYFVLYYPPSTLRTSTKSRHHFQRIIFMLYLGMMSAHGMLKPLTFESSEFILINIEHLLLFQKNVRAIHLIIQ